MEGKNPHFWNYMPYPLISGILKQKEISDANWVSYRGAFSLFVPDFFWKKLFTPPAFLQRQVQIPALPLQSFESTIFLQSELQCLDFFIGPLCGGVNLAAKQATNDHKTIFAKGGICPSGAPPAFLQRQVQIPLCLRKAIFFLVL